jgi:WD40 repeat protein
MEPLAVTFSADGTQLLTGGGDKLIATLDVASGKTMKKSGKLDDPVATLDLSPDGASVAALLMHADNLTLPAPIIVSELATGRRLTQWMPPSVALWSGWTADGRLLVATGDDRGVHVWHVR